MSNTLKPLTTFKTTPKSPIKTLMELPVNTVFQMNDGGNVYIKLGNGPLGTSTCSIHCIHDDGVRNPVTRLEGECTAFRVARTVEVTF